MLQKTRKMLGWASFLTGLSILIFILNHVNSCTRETRVIEQQKTVVVDKPLPECDGVPVGEVRNGQCVAPLTGKTTEVCTASGWVLVEDCTNAPPPPPPDGCIAFESARPILDEFCVRCHSPLSGFEGAKSWSEKIKTRIGFPLEDPRHMPPQSQEQPSPEIRGKIENWINGGSKETCDVTPPPPPTPILLGFDYVEASLFKSSIVQKDATQNRTRWLIATHKYNEGGEAAVKLWVAAAEKAINSVSVSKSALVRLKPADEKKTIWYFDLDDAGLNVDDWKLIEQEAEIKIVSETDLGRAIRDIVGTDSPWMHIDNFVDTTQKNPKVYYALTRTPATQAALQLKLGVDSAGELTNLEALFIGTNRSPIALEKNRLLVRFKSDAGFWWESFDTLDDGNKESNLSEFPLIAGTGSKKLYDFEASEVIYTLPNGMHGYALYNDKGDLQNAAPLNIVADNRGGPLGPEIKVGISCHKCHAGGVLLAVDEIRDHVTRNAAQFLRADVDRVLALYHAKGFNDAQFTLDNSDFSRPLAALGADPANDPINLVEDYNLSVWSAKKFADYLFLSEADLKTLLNQSPTGQAQLGGLLTGNSVTYGQLRDAFAQVTADMGVFQERLGQ